MLSVITLTYQRHKILEEAIESFLRQDYDGPSEMLVINDSPEVDYVFEHPKVKIFNLKERFESITKKLEWGMKNSSGSHMYRLDDDDLLAPWALSSTAEDIENNPGYDIYRSKDQYFFIDNKFEKIATNVNNGNVYSREYVNKIVFPDKQSGEDVKLTFGLGGKIYEPSNKRPTMIYRWGMNTYHVSEAGVQKNKDMQFNVDRSIMMRERGTIHLSPKFKTDYYSQLPK